MKTEKQFRAGDWVEVRAPGEIAQTLDKQGMLQGLPFMPEMMEFCGQRFRVRRGVEKTCVEVAPHSFDFREFLKNDVVTLEGLRCSGAAHDKCQRFCSLFWKSTWLRKVEAAGPASPNASEGHATLSAKLRTEHEPGRYLCQSTELQGVTRPMSRGRRLAKCLTDVRRGNVGFFEMIKFIAYPLWRKATDRFRPRLAGTLKKTPRGILDLKPGETVEVLSPKEIVATLDASGRNRGLLYNHALVQFSGKQFRVRNQVERIISESTGEMRSVEGTVMLEEVYCPCHVSAVGGCSRQDPLYWREIWLKRVDPCVPGIASPVESGDAADCHTAATEIATE